MNTGSKVDTTNSEAVRQITDRQEMPFSFEVTVQEATQILEGQSTKQLYQLRGHHPGFRFMIDPIILNRPLNEREVEKGDCGEVPLGEVESIMELYEVRKQYLGLKSIIDPKIMEVIEVIKKQPALLGLDYVAEYVLNVLSIMQLEKLKL